MIESKEWKKATKRTQNGGGFHLYVPKELIKQLDIPTLLQKDVEYKVYPCRNKNGSTTGQFVLRVRPFNPDKTCSNCGYGFKKNIWEGYDKCPNCQQELVE